MRCPADLNLLNEAREKSENLLDALFGEFTLNIRHKSLNIASYNCHIVGMRPLSEYLRKRILKKREQGYSPTDISNLFAVSCRAIYRLYDRYDRTGSIKARKT